VRDHFVVVLFLEPWVHTFVLQAFDDCLNRQHCKKTELLRLMIHVERRRDYAERIAVLMNSDSPAEASSRGSRQNEVDCRRMTWNHKSVNFDTGQQQVLVDPPWEPGDTPTL
jgi:hypothetical protein